MTATVNGIVWTEEDMIDATLEWFGEAEYLADDCEVRRDDTGKCVVVHLPTGRTSCEAGDGGRW